MIYIKVLEQNGKVKNGEKLDAPVYVRQCRNGIFRCKKHYADGILSADASEVYQFEGRRKLERANYTAQIFTAAEYEELIGEM